VQSKHEPQQISCRAMLPAIDARDKVHYLNGESLRADTGCNVKKEMRAREREASLKTAACVYLRSGEVVPELDLLE